MPPAAANDGGKSSHKSQSHSSVTKNAATATNATTAADPKTTKLCHIVKRADFDGYGFNLHTEKSKPGQFIGKVDANSPAEAAGLREGYRILEVNGIPINNETHKQVVQRIKAIAWEVKLLVSLDAAENLKPDETSGSKTDEKQTSNNNGDKNHNKMTTNSGNGTPATPPPPMATKTISTPTTPTTPTAAVMNSNANEQHANNGKHAGSIEMVSSTKATATSIITTTTTATITPPPPPSMTTKLNDANAAAAHANAAPSPSSASALKLPSTAAEMRAILQSKKKFNPKSEEVNLQEKYEIIQKL